jgi:hypothetical protein
MKVALTAASGGLLAAPRGAAGFDRAGCYGPG